MSVDENEINLGFVEGPLSEVVSPAGSYCDGKFKIVV